MQARMRNPAMILDGVMPAMLALNAATEKSGLPEKTAGLVHLRASQINGCAVCLDMHAKTDDRLMVVAAWRDAACFTDAERAALALTEAVTRIGDATDPVPDAIWNEATKHHDEKQLAALVRVEPLERRHTADPRKTGWEG